MVKVNILNFCFMNAKSRKTYVKNLPVLRSYFTLSKYFCRIWPQVFDIFCIEAVIQISNKI